jgi:predicted nucleotidyltransferase
MALSGDGKDADHKTGGPRYSLRSESVHVMNVPKDLSELFQAIASEFRAILGANLVAIYLWGSLTYDAFDETCSDVDTVVVTQRDLDDHEFSRLDEWFKRKAPANRWVARLDMRFVIDHEFLDKSSRCCGFYPYTGKLVRQGSDGNPIMMRHNLLGSQRAKSCGRWDGRIKPDFGCLKHKPACTS